MNKSKSHKQYIKELDKRIDWDFVNKLKEENPQEYVRFLERGRKMLELHRLLREVGE